ncbi:MAG: hypothetical protein HUU20_05380 [Pirellulales bacterium]|nr:hypothetical protein [Pirellulales bacterium]
MANNSRPSANAKKLAELKQALAEILGEATRRGFHGKACIGVKVQDGAIQQIIRTIERVNR